MPRPGFMWRHVIISTRRSWLHGDQRGFRSRDHRIHSSGDYKNPPPPGEHKGLLDYHERHVKGTAVKIPKPLRKPVLLAILNTIRKAGYRVLVIAVTRKHAHILIELPRTRPHVKRIVGKWKCARTREVRATLPGSIWGEGGKYKPVRTREHLRAAYKYIRDDQGPGAVVWTFNEGLVTPTPRKGPHRDAAHDKPRAQRREERPERSPGFRRP